MYTRFTSFLHGAESVATVSFIDHGSEIHLEIRMSGNATMSKQPQVIRNISQDRRDDIIAVLEVTADWSFSLENLLNHIRNIIGYLVTVINLK